MDDFSIPHPIINRLVPAAGADDWKGLVKRADQIQMERVKGYRCGATQENGAADQYEGVWLKKWVDGSGAQRLHPAERGLVPLFHDLTQPLEAVGRAHSPLNFAPVPWDQIEGEHKGVDLKALARRIAETSYEANDGDPTLLALRAMVDAREAHSPAELDAINTIMWRYFGREVTFSAHENQASGVAASFVAKERPYSITGPSRCSHQNDRRPLLYAKRDVLSLDVKAPIDARVSAVPIDQCGRFLEGMVQGDVGPSGEVRLDLTKFPKETAQVALYVVHDEDGPGPKPPVARSRVSIPMPGNDFHWHVDNKDRTARLKSGQPEAA